MDTLSNGVRRGLTICFTAFILTIVLFSCSQTPVKASPAYIPMFTYPTSGVVIRGGTTINIDWILGPNFWEVDLYFYRNGSTTPFKTAVAYPYSPYEWTVPTDYDCTTYQISMVAKYRIGYLDDSCYDYTGYFTVDATKPTGSITINNGATYTNNPVVALNLSYWDNLTNVTYMRFTNGGNWTTWWGATSTVGWNLTDLNYGGTPANGGKSVAVQFMDGAGNISDTIFSAGIIYDNTPPSSSVSSPAYSPTENFTVSWTGTDNLSGIASYGIQYKEGDTGAWTNWENSSTPAGGSKVFTGGNGVKYYFRSIALDNAGNTSISAPVSTTVVTLPPSPPAILMNGFYVPTISNIKYSWNWNGTPSITGTAIDNGSGISKVFLQVQRVSDGAWWNGASWGASTVTLEAGGTTTWTIKAENNILDGELSTIEAYNVFAYQRDGIGRISPVSCKLFAFLDYPPDLQIDSPLLDAIFDNDIITFEGKADGKINDPQYWMSYAKISGGGPETVFVTSREAKITGGKLGELLPNSLSDGRYSITLYMNIPTVLCTFVGTTIRIDRHAPETAAIVSGDLQSNGWFTSPVNVVLTVFDEGSIDNSNHFAGETYYRINGGSWQPYSPFEINTDGVFMVEYYSEDLVHHVEAVRSEEIKIDLEDPQPEITSPVNGNITNEAEQVFTVACPEDAVAVSINGTPLEEIAGGLWSGTMTLLEGEYTYWATAADASGRQSQDSVTITLDRTPPEIEEIKLNGTVLFRAASLSINGNPAVNPKVTLPTPTTEVRATDNLTDFSNYDGVKVELVNGSGNTVWELTGRSTFAVAQPIATGIYTLRVTATDKAGNSTIEAISDIIVTGGDPEIITKIIVSPNPFDPLSGIPAKIWFTPTGDPGSLIALYIHDITGRLVWKRTFTVGELLITKRVDWNGYTDYGQVASNGGYLLRVVDETQKKLIGKAKIAVIKGTI